MFGERLEVDEYVSKQFLIKWGVRIDVMLGDATRRTYTNNKNGATLLLAHIESAEEDVTAWAPVHTPTDSGGGKLPVEKEKKRNVTLEFFGKRVMGEEEFQGLPETGMVDSRLICFSQLRCSPAFQSEIDLGDVKCGDISDLTKALKSNPKLADAFDPPITIIWYQGRVTSVDNRRLKAHLEAGVAIRYRKKTWITLTHTQQDHFDPQAPAENINVT